MMARYASVRHSVRSLCGGLLLLVLIVRFAGAGETSAPPAPAPAAETAHAAETPAAAAAPAPAPAPAVPPAVVPVLPHEVSSPAVPVPGHGGVPGQAAPNPNAESLAGKEKAAPATADVPAVAAAPAVETPAANAQADAEAARLAEEHKKKREEERKTQMAEAEEFVQIADKTLMETLPYPLNLLLGASIFGITLWRYLAAVGAVLVAMILMWALARRFRGSQRVLQEPERFGRWQLVGAVLVIAMRYASRIILFALLVRGVSSLLVTPYHPDIVWLSNMLIYLGVATYLFDLASIVDFVYGNRIFQGDNRLAETIRPIMVKGVQALIILVTGMHIYQDVTGQTMFSVLAGLGIGGLALALASQETLRNLLGFASIAFDKVFLVGDAVSIAGYDGTIEHVGLRSMRIRTYDGRAVVIPNNTAINSNIINLNRRPYIRREMRIALSPKNTFAKVEQAMELIREAMDTHEGKVAGLPPVVRFVDFEPGRFVIQAMFWYDAQKPFYHDESSRINLEVAKRLCAAEIQYAEWPT